MIPTFTLSNNDLAHLLFRTVAILSLRQLQRWHRNVSFSYSLLVIGEHKWSQTKEVRNHTKSRVLLFTDIIGWLSVAGFYGWLSRLPCVSRPACGRFLVHGSLCWWYTSLRGRASRLRLTGLHLRGTATVLWWTPLRQEHTGSGGLHAHCGWAAGPRSVLEREMFTC
jgi:hypothetical protein